MKNFVAARRGDKKMSQQLLAQTVGVSRQTIIAIEQGRFNPSLPLAFRLARTFGEPIEILFDPQDEFEELGQRG